jgi:hypothetical protein
MLDFFGILLINEESGLIERNPLTYKERYKFLNNSFHNYLRITRILKCLGLCGFENFKLPFLKHFILEIFKFNYLENTKESLLRFWFFLILN